MFARLRALRQVAIVCALAVVLLAAGPPTSGADTADATLTVPVKISPINQPRTIIVRIVAPGLLEQQQRPLVDASGKNIVEVAWQDPSSCAPTSGYGDLNAGQSAPNAWCIMLSHIVPGRSTPEPWSATASRSP